MPQITRQQVDTEVNNQLPTNGVGSITAEIHRALMFFVLDYIDQKASIFYGPELPSEHVEGILDPGDFGEDGDYYIQVISPGEYQFWVKETNTWIETNSLGTNNGKQIFFTLTTLPNPTAVNPGDMWFNFALSAVYLWDGTVWGAFHPIGPRAHFGSINPSPASTYKQQDTYLNLTTAEYFKYLNGAWVSQGTLTAAGTSLISIEYDDLMQLVGTSGLLPNRYYLLTDFVTSHQLTALGGGYEDYISATVEPLIIRAISASELDTEAKSTLHPTDIIKYYHTDSREYAATAGGKGLILYREDPIKRISAYYDWRYTMTRRWETVDGNSKMVAFMAPAGTPTYDDVPTINSSFFGVTCTDIRIGPGTFNVRIGDFSNAITIAEFCGEVYTGITIGLGCKSIFIGSDSAKVGGSGSGYVNGITILNDVYNVYIGQRCYNIAMGDGCYGLHIGTQNNDMSIPPGTFRRRIEKGFSNFEAHYNMGATDTIDMSSGGIKTEADPGVLWSPVNYCGTLYVTSASSEINVRRLVAQLTSASFHPVAIIPESGLVLNFIDKEQALLTNANSNLKLQLHNRSTDGTKAEYITFKKWLVDGLGAQNTDWVLDKTNSHEWPDYGYTERQIPRRFANKDVYELVIEYFSPGSFDTVPVGIAEDIRIMEFTIYYRDQSGYTCYPLPVDYVDKDEINFATFGQLNSKVVYAIIRYIKFA